MSKRLQGFAIGIIVCVLLLGGAAYASNTRTLQASFNNIKIVVDGVELKPQDSNGNAVEPFIFNGTTYLPVRAVASAVGKSVYWDGPNYTVYLGNMNGKLEYPTLRFRDAKFICGSWGGYSIKDQYGNMYAEAYWCAGYAETLLDMKYSHFKGTVFVKEYALNT